MEAAYEHVYMYVIIHTYSQKKEINKISFKYVKSLLNACHCAKDIVGIQ